MPNNKIQPIGGDSDSDDWSDSDMSSVCSSTRTNSVMSIIHPQNKLSNIIKQHFCNVDPVSEIGRKVQMVKVISVSLLPMIALLIETIVTIYGVVVAKEELTMVIEKVKGGDVYSKLTLSLERERMDDVLYMTTSAVTKDQLFENFIQTDKNLAVANQPWEPITYGNDTFTDKEHFHVHLWTFRADTWLKRHGDDILPIVNFYHAAGTAFSKTAIKVSLDNTHDTVWKDMVVWNYILRTIEDISMVKTMGEDLLLHGLYPTQEYLEFIEYEELWREHVTLSRQYSDVFNRIYTERTSQNGTTARVNKISLQILLKNKTFSGAVVAKEWETLTGNIENTLIYITNVIKNGTLSTIDDDLKNADVEVIALGCVLGFIIFLLAFVTYVAYQMVERITEFSVELIQHSEELLLEKKQTEAILHRMLPETIAKQLKKRKTVDAEVFDGVTIFFSDVVGFTAISSQSTPMQVVDFLNKLYQFFDNVLEQHDVYKVETIGDAYMVASGVPHRNGDRHANEIATISLDLRDGIERMQIPHMVTHKLQLRIGLHSGPCVAGVVGNKMPRYCLFGHTVQIASKMESTGVAQKIQITLACKERLDRLAGHVYIIEKRDVLQIEGIGEIERYFLVGRRVDLKSMQEAQKELDSDTSSRADSEIKPEGDT